MIFELIKEYENGICVIASLYANHVHTPSSLAGEPSRLSINLQVNSVCLNSCFKNKDFLFFSDT